MTERELREMLRANADTFEPSPLLPERVLRRTRARWARQLGALGLVALALAAATATALRIGPDQRAFAAFTLIDKETGSSSVHDHAQAGEPLTLGRLERHAQCMRAHGVNVPDPQPTAHGWTIRVNEPPFRNEKAWRNAFFVDCRLENVTENLILGGRTQAGIDELMACTQARGFILPPPTKDASGQFQFDLNKATPAWGSDVWYRVVFVTCAGSLPEP
jgi:hypothetical protein